MGCLPSCLGYAQPRVSHTQTYLNQTGTQPKSPDLAFEGFSWGGMRNLCLCSLSSAQIGAQLWAQNHRLPQLTDPHGITSQMAEHPRHSSRRAFLSCPYAFLFVLPTVKSSRREKKIQKGKRVQKIPSSWWTSVDEFVQVPRQEACTQRSSSAAFPGSQQIKFPTAEALEAHVRCNWNRLRH